MKQIYWVLVWSLLISLIGCEYETDSANDADIPADVSVRQDSRYEPDQSFAADGAIPDVETAPRDADTRPVDSMMRPDIAPSVQDATVDAAAADPFELTSTGFEEGEPIPYEYTCFGEDVQPKLMWRNPPEGTESYAIVLLDETIDFVHWVAYNVPGDVTSLRRGASDDQQLPEGVVEAPAYGGGPFHGPCTPPPGPHTYGFRLYALNAENVPFPFRGRMSSQHLEMAFGENTLAVATLTGTCQPPP